MSRLASPVKLHTPTQSADIYRAYSRAIRIVSASQMDDLKLKSRIVTYLYEEGHREWVRLCALSTTDFANAFDSSRAKAGRA